MAIKIYKIEVGREYISNGRTQECFKIITGNQNGMQVLVSSECRWEDNIRIILKEMGIND